MVKTQRQLVAEEAADSLRINAIDTVRERLGRAAFEALSFNAYEDAKVREILAQVDDFADQYRVSVGELLNELRIERDF